MSKRGLGKGLDALLSTSSLAREKQKLASHSQDISADGELAEISTAHLKRGIYQPRKEMSSEALEELAASIQSQGIIQPIVVRPISDDMYEIIAGERRWRAAKQAGLKVVPCIVKQVDDRATIAMSLIENIQREDLNAIEEAQALERLQDEFKLTHQQVADAIGKSRTTVTNLLRLNQLEESVKQLVEQKKIEMGHARALLSIEGQQQQDLALFIAKKQLTVRQTEALVKKTLTPEVVKLKPVVTNNALHLSERLSEILDAKISVELSSKGSGKITINLIENQDLEAFLNQLATKLQG
jgi:ParB family transcriptional regulator, chromosome partitioning protein